MLTYKAELVGLKVIITEESYTSVASFLDGDFIPVHGSPEAKAVKFSGRRVKRGLYKSKIGIKFNADINGSYNIIRFRSPKCFWQRDRGCSSSPSQDYSGQLISAFFRKIRNYNPIKTRFK